MKIRNWYFWVIGVLVLSNVVVFFYVYELRTREKRKIGGTEGKLEIPRLAKNSSTRQIASMWVFMNGNE